jgi:hypothetical protein
MAGALGPLVQQVVGGLVRGVQTSKPVKCMAVLVMPWTSRVVVPMFDRLRTSLNSVIGSPSGLMRIITASSSLHAIQYRIRLAKPAAVGSGKPVGCEDADSSRGRQEQ